MTQQPRLASVPRIEAKQIVHALKRAQRCQDWVQDMDHQIDEACEHGNHNIKLLQSMLEVLMRHRAEAWASLRTLVFAAAGKFDVNLENQTPFAVLADDQLVVVHGPSIDGGNGPLSCTSGWFAIPLAEIINLDSDSDGQEIVFLPSAN
jgi:hypothetical protein